MNPKPRYRLATDAALRAGENLVLTDKPAHYLTRVLRLDTDDSVALFNRTQGEWCARITAVKKKEIHLTIETCLRPARETTAHLTVCFAPIKGGRMDTIIEKATELGASVLQPVITERTVVDRVNLERAEAIAREAAEQCERIDWPVIKNPMKLMNLLADWPPGIPLIYGDERGQSTSVTELFSKPLINKPCVAEGESLAQGVKGEMPPSIYTNHWAILVGPEGGFTPGEFAALARVNAAIGVSLGPRILRADTAVITLCAITMQQWGDWHEPPRFIHPGD